MLQQWQQELELQRQEQFDIQRQQQLSPPRRRAQSLWELKTIFDQNLAAPSMVADLLPNLASARRTWHSSAHGNQVCTAASPLNLELKIHEEVPAFVSPVATCSEFLTKFSSKLTQSERLIPGKWAEAVRVQYRGDEFFARVWLESLLREWPEAA
jgi:hypothetical protein